MKKKFCIFTFLVLTGILGNILAQPLSDTISVGPSHPDYPTLNAVVDSLVNRGISGPVTILIETGVYQEQFVIPEIQGVSASDTIVFASETGDTADVHLVYEPSGSSDNYIVRLDGTSYITFKNLSFFVNGSSDFGSAIEMINSNKKINFIGNHLRGKKGSVATLFDKYLVKTDDFTDSLLSFKGNRFEESNGALKVRQFYGVEICNNIAFNDDVSSHDFTIDNGSGIKFVNNLIKYGQHRFGDIWSGLNNTISENQIGGTLTLYAWNENAGYKNMVVNNFINSQIFLNYSRNILLCFNSISSNGDGIRIQGCKNISIANNMIMSREITYRPLLFDSDTALYFMDYNNIHSATSVLLTVAGVDYTSLTDWRAASSLSAHDANIDIQFVDAVNADLHVVAGEPDLYGVTDTSVLYDFDGQKRYRHFPNMGADEYSKHPLSGIYTIGPDPTDSFSTFNDALYDIREYGISGNTTIIPDAGEYNVQITLDTVMGANEDNHLKFMSESNNPDDVIIRYATTNYDSSWVIKLGGTDYVTFSGMTLISECAYPIVAYIGNGSSNITIQNCRLVGDSVNSSGGVYSVILSPYNTYGCDNLSISNNEILNGAYGICMETNMTSRVKGTLIKNNVFKGQYESAISIYFQDSVMINHNNIVNHSDYTTPYGIYLYDVTKPIVNGNTIHIAASTGGGYGIMLMNCANPAGDSGIIANNAVSIISRSSLVCLGITNRDSQRNGFYHNSVHIEGSNPNSQSFKVWGSCSNIVAKNNIFSNDALGYVYFIGASGFVSNFNNFHSRTNLLFSYGGTYNSLEEFQSGTSLDTNSLSVDPMFVSDSNLHIYHGNALLDSAGTPVLSDSLFTDIDMQLRDTTHPDIGADEYVYIRDGKEILTLEMDVQLYPAMIDEGNATVTEIVADTANLVALSPEFTLSDGAILKLGADTLISGLSIIDFTDTVLVIVQAEDGTEKEWTIMVSKRKDGKNILTFTVPGQVSPATISTSNGTVNIVVDEYTNVGSLTSEFTLSEGAVLTLEDDTIESGSIAINFTDPVTFAVRAENETSKNWTVTITKETNIKNENVTNDLRIYPNPFSDKLYIEVLTLNEDMFFQLSDLSGKIVRSGMLKASENVHEIPIGELSGTFILRVIDLNDNSSYTTKLISE